MSAPTASPARIGIAAERAFRACPRALGASSFCAWLETHSAGELELPRQGVTVELLARPELSRGQVGRFQVEGYRRGSWSDEFWVRIALGEHPDGDFEAQLASIPHELGHVTQWLRLFGERTPWAVVEPDYRAHRSGLPSLEPWRRFDHEGGGSRSPEAIARRLTSAFARAFPDAVAPRCPAGCGCRRAA